MNSQLPNQVSQTHSHKPDIARCFSYGTTALWARVYCGIAMIIGLSCAAAFYYWSQWAGSAPLWSKWIVLLMAIGFLFSACNPRNWQAWTSFAADRHGMYFPDKIPTHHNTQWLHVPWDQVGDIRQSQDSDGQLGISIPLKISEAEAAQFFPVLSSMLHFLIGDSKHDGWYTVQYRRQSPGIATALAKLRDLKIYG